MLAVAHTPSPHHMPRPVSSSQFPMDKKTSTVATKSEDKPTAAAGQASTKTEQGNDGTVKSEAVEALAPPPRPTQSQSQQAGAENDDYFSAHKGAHLSREPNPFDQSFGAPSSDTPASKSLLPPVASLTSPAPLAGDGPSAGGYSYSNSLRAGPLSPAMLGGPVGASDYFDPSLRGTTFASGVTPNESSLRTGLTPGGGGSMFPAPSPTSQALYQQLASGGATPGTLDFHRTAMNAAASKANTYRGNGSSTSQADEKRAPVAAMDPALQNQAPPQATFGQHDNDAANGLYMLAQATGSQSNGSFVVPSTANAPSQQGRSQDTSPTVAHRLRNGDAAGSAHAPSDEMSDDADQGKPTTRSKGKKPTAKSGSTTNGRRKADDTPAKPPPNKKAKANQVAEYEEESDEHEEMPDTHPDGKKMTDEEKRKNFLERNRVAALKCRQRKKQWLANLQAKVEIFSNENDTLSAQVTSLREEIMGLKTLLLQHKDCPVSQSQGLNNFFNQQPEFNPHANPYGMGVQHGQQVMAGQRR